MILSQDDMTVVLRTLSENLSEKSDAIQSAAQPSRDQSTDSETGKESQGPGSAAAGSGKLQIKRLLEGSWGVNKVIDHRTAIELFD